MNLLVGRGEWLRVYVERVKCSVCGAELLIANPAVADLYLGAKDWVDAMRNATASGSMRCVRCGGDLPRFTIWAELLDE